MSEPVLVQVHALDPISESGILAQLRECPDVRVADPGTGRDTKPSVALAVIDLVDDDSTGWLRSLHQRDGLPLVLVVGQLDSRALISVVESGVRAVTRRCEATPLRLAQLLHAAAANRGELPPDLLGQLLDQVGQLNRSLLGPRGLGLNGLTQRENAVLRLVADGLSTREIASQLAYSERTIKTVIQDLTTRLYLRNRAHAVAYAVRNGWI
jgi:DNA-binding NarL/FixJ family response regulator